MLVPVSLLLMSFIGCGPTFIHEPLTGEDPAVLAMLGVSAADLKKPETVAAVEKLHRALKTRQTSVIWMLLSKETRDTLDALASKHLQSNGRAMLTDRRFPTSDGANNTRLTNLVALYLVPRPIRFRAVTNPSASDTTAVVQVTNRKGQKRQLDLRRERGQWTLHHTDYSHLPVIPDIRPSQLPHERGTPKKKPVAPPAEKPADAPAPESEIDTEAEAEEPSGATDDTQETSDDLDF